ncbi:unnamed protein product [Owenia fusiformis]|uniref:Zinc finger CCCH-type with G patch domain-containing protein n=1 Tax=Owenia fusiformis TaxID=6347 RepID=A0A8J1XVW7_OWEFU|nr:unnamed protein product [Owenia fusiformis]
MDEAGIEASLELYKTQLGQVEVALQAAGGSEDLLKLRSDLQELIKLTEDSLLQLRKSNLLSMLGEDSQSSKSNTTQKGSSTSATHCNDLDDEFAAFQAAINEEDSISQNTANTSQESYHPTHNAINTSQKPYKSTHNATASKDDSDSPQRNDASLDSSFSDLCGTRCRVPHSEDWGPTSYHNAVILKVESIDQDDTKIRVLLCNPTKQSLKPCSYLLDGTCRFSEDSCRYSHGFIVSVDDLEEYKDPDYSQLQEGRRCLAKYEDDLWYEATVDDVGHENTCAVKYKSYDEVVELPFEDILPFDHGSTEESDEDNLDTTSEENKTLEDNEISDDSSEEDAVPMVLWDKPKTLQCIGEWETHTKGIASKLMAKMGFVVGQGLGKNGRGRAEPVPIHVLPPGKSLDQIMKLKEIAGERDLIEVMKKEKRKTKKQKKQMETGYTEKKEKQNVFDFINKKLGHKKANINDLVKGHNHFLTKSRRAEISEKDLKSKTEKSINVQLLKTSEELRNTEKEIVRLKQGLKRNEGRDPKMARTITAKLQSLEKYMEQLKTSEKSIEKHRESASSMHKTTSPNLQKNINTDIFLK